MLQVVAKVGSISFFILISWIVYERIMWPENYMNYDAPYLSFGPLDTSYPQLLNPQLFSKATIHSDPIKLRNHEDIAVGNDGTIYTGLEDGSLMSIAPNGQIKTLYKHEDCGKIEGIVLTSDERILYYATSERGLIKFDMHSREPQYLLSQIQGKFIPAMNGICIDQQKQIIFITDCSTFKLLRTGKEIFLKRRSGRILSYNLQTSEAKVVLSNLAYPNGIVFHKQSQSIIFSEMTHHSISKFKVYEHNAQKQLIIDNLFGYPDNLKLNQQGDLYVGFPAARDPSIEKLNQDPARRKYLMYIPEALLEMLITKIAGGIKIDLKTGEIKQYIFGSTSQTHTTTTILEKGGKLYFASLRSPTIVVVDMKDVGNAEIKAKEETEL